MNLFLFNYNSNSKEILSNDDILSNRENKQLSATHLLDNVQFESYIEPKISVINKQNQRVNLKELRGNFLIVYFFATWCSSCYEELKTLNQLKNETNFLDIKDFLIIPISIDYKNFEQISSFFKSLGINNIDFFIDQNKIAMSTLSVKSLPTTFLIDHNGYIFEKMDKNINWSKKEIINNLIKVIEDKRKESATIDQKKQYSNTPNSDIIFNKDSFKKVTIIN